jgi:hypothetical protein
MDVVSNGYAKIIDTATEAQYAVHSETKKKDGKALFYIHRCVDDANFEKIVSAKNAKEVWGILAHSYVGVDRLKNVHL